MSTTVGTMLGDPDAALNRHNPDSQPAEVRRNWVEIAFAIILVCFGAAKIGIFAALLTGNYDEKARLDLKKGPLWLFVTADRTVAGLLADICLILMGIYSILYGGAILDRNKWPPLGGLGSSSFGQFILDNRVVMGFLGAIGGILLVLYTIVMILAAIRPQQSDAFSNPAYRGEYSLYWLFGWFLVTLSGSFFYNTTAARWVCEKVILNGIVTDQPKEIQGETFWLYTIVWATVLFIPGWIAFALFDYWLVDDDATRARIDTELEKFKEQLQSGRFDAAALAALTQSLAMADSDKFEQVKSDGERNDKETRDRQAKIDKLNRSSKKNTTPKPKSQT